MTECTDYSSSSSAASSMYLIMNNASNTQQVLTTTQNGSELSFLAPANPPPGLDYRTSTIAISSSCQPLSQQCQLDSSASSKSDFPNINLVFNCSSDFQSKFSISSLTGLSGNVDSNGHGQTNPNGAFWSFPPNWTYSDPGVWPPTLASTTTNDSISFSTGTLAFVNETINFNPSLLNDPEMLLDSGWLFYLLGCNIAVYNMTYSWVNNTIATIHLVPSDETVAFYLENYFGATSEPAQLSYTVISTVVRSNSSAQVAVNYAQSLAKIMAAFTASAFEPLTNTEEQLRQNIIVAHVPKAPLFTLISFCLLFALLGLALFVIALLGQSAETRKIQAQLNIFGMTASRFESPKDADVNNVQDLFEERKRGAQSTKVGMVRSEGGRWAYVSSHEERTPGALSFRSENQEYERDD